MFIVLFALDYLRSQVTGQEKKKDPNMPLKSMNAHKIHKNGLLSDPTTTFFFFFFAKIKKGF